MDWIPLSMVEDVRRINFLYFGANLCHFWRFHISCNTLSCTLIFTCLGLFCSGCMAFSWNLSSLPWGIWVICEPSIQCLRVLWYACCLLLSFMFAIYAFAYFGIQESTDNYTPLWYVWECREWGRVCNQSDLAVFIVHMFGFCLLLESMDYDDGDDVVSCTCKGRLKDRTKVVCLVNNEWTNELVQRHGTARLLGIPTKQAKQLVTRKIEISNLNKMTFQRGRVRRREGSPKLSLFTEGITAIDAEGKSGS